MVPIILHHQNFMMAVRQEMGWPLFRPVNDSIGFCAGSPMDVDYAMEVARIAQTMRKDLITTAWTSANAAEPTDFAIVYRELLTVDVIDRVFPWAECDDSAVILVSTRKDEFFMIGRRGSLERVPGKPKRLAKGRKLAMKRIKRAAAGRGEELLANNLSILAGAQWSEPASAMETVVRFN